MVFVLFLSYFYYSFVWQQFLCEYMKLFRKASIDCYSHSIKIGSLFELVRVIKKEIDAEKQIKNIDPGNFLCMLIFYDLEECNFIWESRAKAEKAIWMCHYLRSRSACHLIFHFEQLKNFHARNSFLCLQLYFMLNCSRNLWIYSVEPDKDK